MDVEIMASGRTGFPLLAQRISLSPDYESFIFRKFDRLSARNLLHLEGKLAYLEHKLDQADEQAALPTADNEARRSVRAWEAFEENAANPDRPEHMHMKLAEQVHETLKEYPALEAPKNRAFDVAHNQFYEDINDEFGHTKRQRPLLAGLAECRLEEGNRRDLVAVRRPADKDLLSRFLQDHWIFKV
ncbi:uncharacterized protein B0H64DRAFT_465913 [Chaetomium fimeti]|uniref:DUF6594 domain-containing protein n=1 Tax=Chaetomium fimeti TaxID=1854472 RepID=A0AAE0HDE3_9PEZI|nr:hypothetical protein B0H64DRAFT_465913 [Chaetomium fimeti]